MKANVGSDGDPSRVIGAGLNPVLKKGERTVLCPQRMLMVPHRTNRCRFAVSQKATGRREFKLP